VPDFVNIGTGEEISIKNLAEIIKKAVGFEGKIKWDTDRPDGAPKRLLDSTKIHQLGWEHRIGLEEGIKKTYDWFLENIASKK